MYISAPHWLGPVGLCTAFLSSACLSPDTYPGDLATSTGGAATGGAATGTTGGEGGGPMCPAGISGTPVSGTAGQWTWVPIHDAKCRDGSSTGFGVRLRPESKNLFVYFGGQGACFNAASCLQAEYNYSSSKFDTWKNDGGAKRVFKTDNNANAFKDWNAVYVPYCTGDLHSGGATGANVPGIASQDQSFVGYNNVGLFLEQLVPTFQDVTKIVVMGVGAGGFGATFNFHRIAQAFCPVPTILIDDAGPLMSDTYLAPCLQHRLRELWGMNPNFPLDCAGCTGEDGGMINYVDYLSSRYPEGRFALISSMDDETVRFFYGFGQDACANLDNFASSSLSQSDYTAGLGDLRTNHMDGPSWASYYIPGSQHGYLDNKSYANTTVNGVDLIDWVANIVEDGPMANVGP